MTNPFDPTDAAISATDKPIKKKEPQSAKEHHAAIPKGSKPTVTAEMPTVKATTNFPAAGDPYWKQHPLQTEHNDGSVRQWGEDTTAVRNPNLLPQQMMPPLTPVPVVKNQLDLSDKATGKDNNYMNKRDQNKGPAIPEIKSNNYK